MDIEEMQRQLQTLTDRAEITDLLDRYLRSLDEGFFDEEWARAFHTEDVVAEMPIGRFSCNQIGTATGNADGIFQVVNHGVG